MESFFNNIIIVSLCDSLSVKVADALSQSLGMMFCSTKDLVEYELIDKNRMEELCTKEYLEACEKRVIKRISTFENVVVSMSFDYLIHNINILKKKSLIVFLQLSKKYVEENGNSVDVIAHSSRTSRLKEISNVSINLRKTEPNEICEKIIEALGRIL